MSRALAALLIACLALPACSDADSVLRGSDATGSAEASLDPPASPSEPPDGADGADGPGGKASDGKPSGSARGLDDWEIGATELPLRPDGYGQVRRTPPELRVRRLATTDLLPPPPDERFRSRVTRVTAAWAQQESLAWERGCPVGLGELRRLRLTFRGFDGEPHTGQMVVHQRVARDVVQVFRRLYAADFPIEQMTLVRKADLDAPPTGDGNNTGAYACRATVGSDGWSAHAYGLAVDVNPFMNPYQRGDLVLPELASAYTARDRRRPGMIRAGDVVTTAFADIGWSWGGSFRTVTDPMHFSATGR